MRRGRRMITTGQDGGKTERAGAKQGNCRNAMRRSEGICSKRVEPHLPSAAPGSHKLMAVIDRHVPRSPRQYSLPRMLDNRTRKRKSQLITQSSKLKLRDLQKPQPHASRPAQPIKIRKLQQQEVDGTSAARYVSISIRYRQTIDSERKPTPARRSLRKMVL